VSELSPDAQSFIRGCRSAARPTLAEQERVTAMLRARLGDAALPLESATTNASSAVLHATRLKLSAVALAIGAAGGALVLSLAGPVHVRSVPAPTLSVVITRQAAPAAPVAEEPASAPPLASSGREPMISSIQRPGDRLAQEVAIMSRATSQLHAGRPAAALKAIAEHQQKFPNGVLAQERRAARVQALCALGRNSEAAPELDRLLRAAPRSPTTLRAAQACGAGSPSQHGNPSRPRDRLSQ